MRGTPVEFVVTSFTADVPLAPSFEVLSTRVADPRSVDGNLLIASCTAAITIRIATTFAILLDDLDPESDDWENFYLKFRYTLTLIDFPVLIAEDNDGGHELELGELPLPETYVAKRNYEDFSIDHDLEREKYDAMIAKLFELLERNDRLFTWTDRDSFEHAVRAIAEQTRE